MPVAKLKQILEPNSEFCKNDCINKKIFKIFEIFEKFLAHSTRLDKPEKTALAAFLRFLALKKVFSNHLSTKVFWLAKNRNFNENSIFFQITLIRSLGFHLSVKSS